LKVKRTKGFSEVCQIESTILWSYSLAYNCSLCAIPLQPYRTLLAAQHNDNEARSFKLQLTFPNSPQKPISSLRVFHKHKPGFPALAFFFVLVLVLLFLFLDCPCPCPLPSCTCPMSLFFGIRIAPASCAVGVAIGTHVPGFGFGLWCFLFLFPSTCTCNIHICIYAYAYSIVILYRPPVPALKGLVAVVN
jgi:hypothetical protein